MAAHSETQWAEIARLNSSPKIHRPDEREEITFGRRKFFFFGAILAARPEVIVPRPKVASVAKLRLIQNEILAAHRQAFYDLVMFGSATIRIDPAGARLVPTSKTSGLVHFVSPPRRRG